jgi:hypothetical protein
MAKFATVDEYVAAQPEPLRAIAERYTEPLTVRSISTVCDRPAGAMPLSRESGEGDGPVRRAALGASGPGGRPLR